MKIFRHVYQTASLVADRNLFQYLFVGDTTVLLDTGAPYTPNETISPFLKENGIEPSRLTLAINTHADADHHGGNASLKQIAGQMMLACGELYPAASTLPSVTRSHSKIWGRRRSYLACH
jgi:glyoxylase-like metal-dependent hydrolase (beta-lactamase superfamily II)